MKYETVEHKISDSFSVKIHPENALDCDITLILEGQKDLRVPFVAEVIGALGEKFGKEFTQNIIMLVAMTMGGLKERGVTQ